LIEKIRNIMLQVVVVFALLCVPSAIIYPISLLLRLIPDNLAPLNTALGMLLVAVTIGVDVFLILKFRKPALRALGAATGSKPSKKEQG
jgi:hypothetical protein